ncbi:O-antigen ligase family protein, partial [Hymenobacter defluvii]
GWLTSKLGMLVPGLLIGAVLAGLLVVLVFLRPRFGVIGFVAYCYIMGLVSRNFSVGVPLGLGMDGLLLLTWVAVLFNRAQQTNWGQIRNDLCVLSLVWFIINVLEIANPAGASLTGWFYEMRSTTLYWLLTVPLAFIVFNKPQDLRLFLMLIICFSVLGALYGIKQKVLGLSVMDQQWLDSGQARTHLIWGKLRVFSFYAEAAQFGASQAHVGLICLILALGPLVWWKRILFGVASLLLFYGMLISGTRGAMFVLATGVFIYLVLNKQLKILLLGFMLAVGLFFVLKYTTIGNGNADIVRLRSSLDPQDPSFQLRLMNQAKLREYLTNRPFGEGVGTIGNWGHQFNSDKYISTIEPDSYYVKIWAEYGIVGFLIWFGIMLSILGKCCGIVWNIQNPLLRQKLLALTAGFGGILVSSYGNEVMNQVPSAMIIYLSWVFVFLGPQLDSLASATTLSGNE